MLVVATRDHYAHAPADILIRGHVVPTLEAPARAEELFAAVQALGHHVIGPRDFGLAPILAVHTADYVEFLQTAAQRWQESGAGDIVRPHTFAVRPLTRRPESIQGQAGYYITGGSAPIEKGTWVAALASAHIALEAASAILDGASEAYALSRPPGHHAHADLAGGFCYLNNAAIAAHHLSRQRGRVAILDIDVHHGNGTQAIFYERADVLYVSTHADPNRLYPFYAGYADERGAGAGLGFNLNLPLPQGAQDPQFLGALDRGLNAIRDFDPAVLLISLGFDTFAGDPSADLSVSTEGFRAAGRRIGGLNKPTLLVQEGGYVVEHLGRNLIAFLDGFFADRTPKSIA